MNLKQIVSGIAVLVAGTGFAAELVDRTVAWELSGKWDLVRWDGYVPYGQRTAENVEYGLRLFVDGKFAGRVACPSYPNASWRTTAVGTLDRLRLPAGRHLLTVMVDGCFNLGELTFTRAD